MSSLIFESHATSTDNEKKIASGWLDPSLSKTGIEQAKQLGARYQHQEISKIYVSDLIRSYETAEIAFANRRIPIVQDQRLREWNYGTFNGAPIEVVEKLKIHYLENPFPEGESLKQVMERFDLFKKEHLEKENILIIGHRATFYALEFYFRGVSLKEIVETPWAWQPGWRF